MLLNNYFWALWSIMMLREENYGRTDIFNLDFADARVHIYNHAKNIFYDKL
jgi:hypothetical protein